MIELDDRLRLLQRQGQEWGEQLRPYALELDRNPDAIHRHLDLPVIRGLATLQIPPEHNPDPLRIGGQDFYLMSALERVVFFEECAKGDLGMLLAAPGPPMAGAAVASLGDRDQQAWFFGRLAERPTWTFFALTEPGHGSDAAAVQTTLSQAAGSPAPRLNGEKRYIGNAARAGLGVVVARTGSGPFGIAVVLIDVTEAAGFSATPIPTLGLRGIQLCTIRLDDVEIPAGRLLGRHLSSSRRGMWGLLRTFNLLRPVIASMGVGIAQAAYDYVLASRHRFTPGEADELDAMRRRIVAVRMLTRRAAIEADRDPDNGAAGSAAKVRAARLAEQVTSAAARLLGPGARLDHPLLDKLARDAPGIEFMEGTSNMQRLSLHGPVMAAAS